MNSLDQFNAVRSQITVGSLPFWWGGGVFSHAIEFLSGNGPSHVQFVYRIDPDGTIWVAESTMGKGEPNGIQINRLDQSILAYPDGSTCGVAILSPEANARADWPSALRYIDSVVGKVNYDPFGLVKFLLPEGLREGELNDHKMVCSAFVDKVLDVAGVLRGVPYSQASPELLIEEGIYWKMLPLLGNPQPHNFNVLT